MKTDFPKRTTSFFFTLKSLSNERQICFYFMRMFLLHLRPKWPNRYPIYDQNGWKPLPFGPPQGVPKNLWGNFNPGEKHKFATLSTKLSVRLSLTCKDLFEHICQPDREENSHSIFILLTRNQASRFEVPWEQVRLLMRLRYFDYRWFFHVVASLARRVVLAGGSQSAGYMFQEFFGLQWLKRCLK